MVSCSNKNIKKFDKRVVNRPVKSAISKGIITLFNGSSTDFIYFNMKKDREKAYIELNSQFGFNLANVYKRFDSLWVVIPAKKVVYFQEKSNILLVPGLGENGISFGMLFDLMIANFSLSYSICYPESDYELIEALNKGVRYSFYEGKLANIDYSVGNDVYNCSIKYLGAKIKINIKKNSTLKIMININELTLQSNIPDNIFIPKIPHNFQKVDL